MPRLTDLPDVPLLNIFNRLSLWNILQLAKLCHRLNNIKQVVFRKRTQLSLFGDCRTSMYHLTELKKIILNIDQNNDEFIFELILKFDVPPDNYWDAAVKRDANMIKLSHDIQVRSLEQMTNLAEMFPNLKRLTVAFSCFFKPPLLGQLLRNWPKLTHLYFVDFTYNLHYSLDYDNAIMEINNLHDLQVLAMFATDPGLLPRNWPLKIIEPLLQNSTKLHTLYFPVGFGTKFVGQNIELKHRFKRQLNVSLQIPFDRFERFGLTDFRLDETVLNDQLIRKTTRIEVGCGTALSRLVNWSALQYLSLKINSKSYSLSYVIDSLVYLHNLHEFHLFHSSNITFRMPLESRARQLPQLPSVRKFEFCSKTSPYKLYRFKWALPNVAEFRLRLLDSVESPESKNFSSFCTRIKSEYDTLPESCALDMKQAYLAYGREIQYFYWIYYRNGRKDDGVAELVPLVERCTKMVAGMRRINFDLEEIAQLSNDD